jgi:transposase
MVIERVGLEACSLAAWLHARLTEAGLPAVCIEARQAKAARPSAHAASPSKKKRSPGSI